MVFLDPPSNQRMLIVGPSGVHANLQVAQGPVVARGLRFYPPWLRRLLERRWLSRLEHVWGRRIDIIWSFENSRFFDLRFAANRIKIYHQVDFNQDFHVRTAARTADVCFCTTDFIQRRLASHNSHVFKIHHGTADFALTRPALAMQHNSLAYDGPQAAYIGNLDIRYLDIDLLAEVVCRNPTVRFHFIGSYSKDGGLWRRCGDLQNVVWWGRVDSQMIPSVIALCDVLLCVYRADEYREQLASPHKFMEYFASGKTVVATYTDEYKDKRHLVEMASEGESFLAVFDRVISNLSEYNGDARRAARIAFAAENSYDKQVDHTLNIVRRVPFKGASARGTLHDR